MDGGFDGCNRAEKRNETFMIVDVRERVLPSSSSCTSGHRDESVASLHLPLQNDLMSDTNCERNSKTTAAFWGECGVGLEELRMAYRILICDGADVKVGDTDVEDGKRAHLNVRSGGN